MMLKLSAIQSLDLELKLNTSPFSRKWVDLGDILYAWRLDPRYNKLTHDTSYTVSRAQYEWIKENITGYSTNSNDNQFTFFIRDPIVCIDG
jgi:hypothetical protein